MFAIKADNKQPGVSSYEKLMNKLTFCF